MISFVQTAVQQFLIIKIVSIVLKQKKKSVKALNYIMKHIKYKKQEHAFFVIKYF